MTPTRDAASTNPLLLASVFFLVSSAFTVVYITQPVLPVLQAEFGVSAAAASLSVSAVILGVALATLPFGFAADRYPARSLMLIGSAVVITGSLVCAWTDQFPLLISLRFLQGLAMPALTTCVAAYLARTLPPAQLNVMMGAYVSATVAGGLGGRLLGGWIHPPLHWRYAFVSSAVLLLAAIALLFRRLRETPPVAGAKVEAIAVIQLVTRPALLRAYLAAFGSFAAFSTAFNYFPFYLAEPPWRLPTGAITSLYLVYVVGLVMGPLAGRLSNRVGNASILIGGALLFALSLFGTLVHAMPVLIASLIGICAGFFATHAAAVGALNRSLTSDRGKANALYTLFYYLGGASGITVAGVLYGRGGWAALTAFGAAILLLPLGAGVAELRSRHRPGA